MIIKVWHEPVYSRESYTPNIAILMLLTSCDTLFKCVSPVHNVTLTAFETFEETAEKHFSADLRFLMCISYISGRVDQFCRCSISIIYCSILSRLHMNLKSLIRRNSIKI